MFAALLALLFGLLRLGLGWCGLPAGLNARSWRGRGRRYGELFEYAQKTVSWFWAPTRLGSAYDFGHVGPPSGGRVELPARRGGPVQRRAQAVPVPHRRAGPYVDWVPYCPEIEIGLGTPREAIRLTAAGRLVNRGGTADHTAAMAALPLPADLDGYVFKAKSLPSCGLRAHRAARGAARTRAAATRARGLYAARVLGAFPLLAAEDEGRLNDPGLREAFVERIFAAARLRSFLAGAWSAAGPGGLPRPAQAADAGARPGALPVGRAGGGGGRRRAA